MSNGVLERKGKSAHKYLPADSDLALLIHDVSRLRKTFYDKVLKPVGITRTQWWLMVNIALSEDGIANQSELAEKMKLSKVTVGAMLTLLDQDGYIERRQDDRDGRVRHISLTDRGHEALRQARQLAAFVNRAIMVGATDEQKQVTASLLSLMKDNLLNLQEDLKVG